MKRLPAAADTRAAEIIDQGLIRSARDHPFGCAEQSRRFDRQLTALRKQTSEYYDSLKKITDAQTASMEQIKRLL